MSPPELPKTQGREKSGGTRKRVFGRVWALFRRKSTSDEDAGPTVQEAPILERGSASKELRNGENSGTQMQPKNQKIGEISGEPAQEDLNGAAVHNPRADFDSALNTPVVLQSTLGDVGERRSGSEDLVQAQELLTLGVSAYEQFKRTGNAEDVNRAIEYWGICVAFLPSSHESRLGLLNNLGIAYKIRFERLGDISDLNEAITSGSQALVLAPEGHPDKPRYLDNLGSAHSTRFERLGDISDLNEAIASMSQAVLLTPEGDQDKTRYLSNLGVAYRTRFERLGDMSDLNEAIAFESQAFELTPEGHPNRPGYLNNLGVAYTTRFESLGDISDLDKAIASGSQAVSLTPDGHPHKPGGLSNLGVAYRTRFERLGDMPDLNEAIASGLQAVSLTSGGHPDKPGYLNNLGGAYRTRFERLGDVSDLNKAIACGSQAVSLTPDGHPNKPITLSNLGGTYRTRYERLGDISDLDEAIACGSQAVSLTPDGHPEKPRRLGNLGLGYTTRFERLGNMSDLNEAIVSGSQAVSLTPDGHPLKPAYLGTLGGAYRARFDRLGNILDLNEAITSESQAVLLTPGGHPDKPQRLNTLGSAYRDRFERLGDMSDLKEAIASGSQAVSLTPDGHPDKPACLGNLGVAYRTRFERLGDISDLNEAIASGSQAVLLTPDGHPHRPGRLTNLAVAYRARFERLGDVSDLNEAIASGSQAVSLTPDGHPRKPITLNNLGIAYTTRFGSLGDISDLDKAIASGSQGVLLTPDGHPDKPGYLNNLGVAYRTRFERLGDMSDLNEAIASGSWAVSLTPDGHPDKPATLNNLGNAYRTRFERLGDMSDINEAIASGSQAVLLTPDGHAHKPTRHNNLGLAYASRFECLSNASDLQSAVSAFTSAAQSPTGPPLIRFQACCKWARLLVHGTSLSAHCAYQRAIELLPLLIWIGSTLKRRHELIVEVGNFSTEAASYAISSNAFDLALEWLEAGRSIIWGQMTQLRAPFEELALHNPSLAKKLRDAGRQLEQAGSHTSLVPAASNSDHDLAYEADNHIKLALRWDELLEEARLISGFEDFLRPPKKSQLIRASQSHPIAVINCHQSGCDALILRPHNNAISHVPLRGFSPEIARNARSDLELLVRQRGSRKPGHLGPAAKNSSLEESLKHLWFGIVEPVLDHLGFTSDPPAGPMPRITWCTTGVLSFFPLHAAGCYDQPNSSTFDRVISSYTPTLSALLTSQSRISGDHCGLVAIGQEHTRGLNPLPCINDELKVIKEHARECLYLQLESDEATTAQVLDAMDQFSWIHLACHGTQNTADPTQSAFHLHDGPLTLAKIASRSFANKGLAFLSACQTATGDEKLPDEAIHLAAGMMMAGFPNVIGTMWSIIDEDGPKVANTVYAELLKDGKMDHTKAARALHQAVSNLRAEVGEKAVERWAPFIHIGS